MLEQCKKNNFRTLNYGRLILLFLALNLIVGCGFKLKTNKFSLLQQTQLQKNTKIIYLVSKDTSSRMQILLKKLNDKFIQNDIHAINDNGDTGEYILLNLKTHRFNQFQKGSNINAKTTNYVTWEQNYQLFLVNKLVNKKEDKEQKILQDVKVKAKRNISQEAGLGQSKYSSSLNQELAEEIADLIILNLGL